MDLENTIELKKQRNENIEKARAAASEAMNCFGSSGKNLFSGVKNFTNNIKKKASDLIVKAKETVESAKNSELAEGSKQLVKAVGYLALGTKEVTAKTLDTKYTQVKELGAQKIEATKSTIAEVADKASSTKASVVEKASEKSVQALEKGKEIFNTSITAGKEKLSASKENIQNTIDLGKEKVKSAAVDKFEKAKETSHNSLVDKVSHSKESYNSLVNFKNDLLEGNAITPAMSETKSRIHSLQKSIDDLETRYLELLYQKEAAVKSEDYKLANKLQSQIRDCEKDLQIKPQLVAQQIKEESMKYSGQREMALKRAEEEIRKAMIKHNTFVMKNITTNVGFDDLIK